MSRMSELTAVALPFPLPLYFTSTLLEPCKRLIQSDTDLANVSEIETTFFRFRPETP